MAWVVLTDSHEGWKVNVRVRWRSVLSKPVNKHAGNDPQSPRGASQERHVQELLRRLECLRDASGQMLHAVNHLIGILGEGSPAFKLAEVDLALLADRACAKHRQFADGKQVVISFESEQSSRVWADPIVVAAALDNLISNAVKYSPRGKTVRVQVRAEQHALVCTVQDQRQDANPSDLLERLTNGMRPLSTHIESSTSNDLAVAKELIERIGGDMWFQTSPDAPAGFSIRLPLISKTQLD
jgi:signal transduction histidine kinase